MLGKNVAQWNTYDDVKCETRVDRILLLFSILATLEFYDRNGAHLCLRLNILHDFFNKKLYEHPAPSASNQRSGRAMRIRLNSSLSPKAIATSTYASSTSRAARFISSNARRSLGFSNECRSANLPFNLPISTRSKFKEVGHTHGTHAHLSAQRGTSPGEVDRVSRTIGRRRSASWPLSPICVYKSLSSPLIGVALTDFVWR